jgi:hypothetical protein
MHVATSRTNDLIEVWGSQGGDYHDLLDFRGDMCIGNRSLEYHNGVTTRKTIKYRTA